MPSQGLPGVYLNNQYKITNYLNNHQIMATFNYSASQLWDELTSTGIDLALTIDNAFSIYNLISWLKKAMKKKASKGLELCPVYLSSCSTMKKIISAGVKEMGCRVSTSDRRAVASYFAAEWIEEINKEL